MDWRQYVVTIGVIVAVIAALSVMFGLFALRRCVKNEEPKDVT